MKSKIVLLYRIISNNKWEIWCYKKPETTTIIARHKTFLRCGMIQIATPSNLAFDEDCSWSSFKEKFDIISILNNHVHVQQNHLTKYYLRHLKLLTFSYYVNEGILLFLYRHQNPNSWLIDNRDLIIMSHNIFSLLWEYQTNQELAFKI